MCMNQTPWVVSLGFFSPCSQQHSLVLCQWHSKKCQAYLTVYFYRILTKISLPPYCIQNTTKKHNIINEQLILNTFEKKPAHFLSCRYVVLAESSIMEGPPASANGAIWCKFDESTGFPQHLTDRQALLKSCLCSSPKSLCHQIGLSIWHCCWKAGPAAQEFCQNWDCSLKEDPAFSLSSVSC